MPKTQRQRQRRHNGKLSRRMKKRGGVKKIVSMNSILGKPLVVRPVFMERLPPSSRTKYTSIGNKTEFTIPTREGDTKFTVDKELDEANQHRAYDHFNKKYKHLQTYFSSVLGEVNGKSYLKSLGHDAHWVCIKVNPIAAGWHESSGKWTMRPKIVECGQLITDEFVSGPTWTNWISTQNDKNTFCVPNNYKKMLLQEQLSVADRH